MSSARLRTPLFAALVVAGAVVCPPAAEAYSPYLVVPEPAAAEATPAYRYANMTDAEAFAELDRRHLVYTKLGLVAGVRAPIRLTARLHGVYFHSSLPPDERVTSLFEILDARLALALDDFAAVLARHDIDEVVHFTMYRPNGGAPDHGGADEIGEAGVPHRKGASARVALQHRALGHGAARASSPSAAPRLDAKIPAPKSSAQPPTGVKQKTPPDSPKQLDTVTAPAPKPGAAKIVHPAPSLKHPVGALPTLPTHSTHSLHSAIVTKAEPLPASKATYAPPGTRHPAGLAIDVGILHKKDGRWISIASAFHGHIGDKTCGEGARIPEEPDARELRALVCESADLGVFTYVLTPDYNAAHADHFHMEIKPGVHWFLYH